MSSIPWMSAVDDLSTGEFAFLLFMLLIASMIAGFVIHALMREAGFGPALNSVLAAVGAYAGIYLRYRLLAASRSDDLALTIGFALGTASLMFLALALIRNRVF
jgi:uncharacterized membrane protein YeaQ/YmgE (transglycosylase-associated protein family)